MHTIKFLNKKINIKVKSKKGKTNLIIYKSNLEKFNKIEIYSKILKIL